MKLLIENKIITQTNSNIVEYLNKLKSISKDSKIYDRYKDFFEIHRELLGKIVWLDQADFEYEKELIDEFLDLENMIKIFINKIK